MYRFYRFMYGLVGFSRSQTNGFLIFLPLMLIIMFSEPVYTRYLATKKPDHSRDIARLDSIVHLMSSENVQVADSAIIRYPVDPNIASADELIQLGLKRELVSRIMKYRSKGGKFRVRKDVAKIWGMDSVLYARIKPLIALPETAAPRESFERNVTPQRSFSTRGANAEQRVYPQNINLADSASLKKVYGIGEKLALRILKFRESLGGFISMAQLKDVYKLDSAVILRLQTQYFIDPHFVPIRLDINESGQQELAAHPYLSSRAANAIVAYRLNHGEFQRIEDLRKIPAIDSIMFRKVRPYLKISVMNK